MKKLMLALTAAASVAMLVGGAYAANKKILAIVVKGLDNPFFSAMGQGCADWNAAHADSEYECLYTGPATAADEAGEIQIVQDLITRGVAGLAISPSNAPAMANLLKSAAPTMPVITIDADLLEADHGLRKTFLGTDNYSMGVELANQTMRLKPSGGTVCMQLGNPAAANINARAAGFRDTIAGTKGIERLANTNGWTEPDGCPVYTNDDIPLANQMMADTYTAHPDLGALVLIGGWAQFAPQAYAQNTDPILAKIASHESIIVAGDTTEAQVQAFQEKRSNVQVGQRPYEMGNTAPDYLIKLIGGEAVADPLYTGLDICTEENPGICAAK